MQEWPQWWHFEIVISSHAIKRMHERDFSEVDVRMMLDDATGYSPAAMPGRFCVETTRGPEPWEVIVEPDDVEQVLVVVTAYRVK